MWTKKHQCFVGVIIAVFLFDALLPLSVTADEIALPSPGKMVHVSSSFLPPVLKGIKVHANNPFRFDFILDKGEGSLKDGRLKEESTRLVKYFLTSLTVPEKDLWVNLSPYEKGRIVPASFGQTEMGRDLLAQDYLLKQITSSLVYPEGDIGKRFWKRIYEIAENKNIIVSTFNKIWIVPDKAVIYEDTKAGTAYVVKSSLKVLTEQDYLASDKNQIRTRNPASSIIRDIVIPQLETEVNSGSNFAQLRQVYSALILAAWYKKKIQGSILNMVYADRNKIIGMEYKGQMNTKMIYERYLEAYKKGVYNYIKEERDAVTEQIVPKKYFSGGFNLAMAALEIRSSGLFFAMLRRGRDQFLKNMVVVGVALRNHFKTSKLMGNAAMKVKTDPARAFNPIRRKFFRDIVVGGTVMFAPPFIFGGINRAPQPTLEEQRVDPKVLEDFFKGAWARYLAKTEIRADSTEFLEEARKISPDLYKIAKELVENKGGGYQLPFLRRWNNFNVRFFVTNGFYVVLQNKERGTFEYTIYKKETEERFTKDGRENVILYSRVFLNTFETEDTMSGAFVDDEYPVMLINLDFVDTDVERTYKYQTGKTNNGWIEQALINILRTIVGNRTGLRAYLRGLILQNLIDHEWGHLAHFQLKARYTGKDRFYLSKNTDIDLGAVEMEAVAYLSMLIRSSNPPWTLHRMFRNYIFPNADRFFVPHFAALRWIIAKLYREVPSKWDLNYKNNEINKFLELIRLAPEVIRQRAKDLLSDNWSPELLKAIEGIEPSTKDAAMKGGIDFNTDKMNLQTQYAGDAIKLNVDPAMLKQLQDAPGFSPEIINILPLQDSRSFFNPLN